MKSSRFLLLNRTRSRARVLKREQRRDATDDACNANPEPAQHRGIHEQQQHRAEHIPRRKDLPHHQVPAQPRGAQRTPKQQRAKVQRDAEGRAYRRKHGGPCLARDDGRPLRVLRLGEGRDVPYAEEGRGEREERGGTESVKDDEDR